MKNQNLVSQKQKLDYLFSVSANLRTASLFEIQSHWGRYLCILTSGFLETALRVIYNDYAIKKSHNKQLVTYVSNALEAGRSRNMNAEALLKLVGSFDKSWRTDLEVYLKSDGRQEAIDSLINLRNVISHGGTVNVSISIVQGYYKKAVEVIEFVEDQCHI